MNWGLGHAVRDVPIIRELIRKNAEVIIAADGRALQLLQKEFPSLKWIRLPGYDIKYKSRGSVFFQVFLQLPNIFFSFFSEREMLAKIIDEEKIDAVISDNRYGLYYKKIFSVFITHQTGIMLPKPLKWLESFLNKINRKQIEYFDECWIPDFESENNLSGDLSHKYHAPRNAYFIGPLSRFTYQEKEKVYDLLILLSGPECQRTVLENTLKEQALQLLNKTEYAMKKVLMVRGLPEGLQDIIATSKNFFSVDFMTTSQLEDALITSDYIIARSGYSSVMDIVALRKKAILIPTPGQTEQEYLAAYFKERKIFYSEEQGEFNLERALHASCSYSMRESLFDLNTELSNKIQSLLEKA